MKIVNKISDNSLSNQCTVGRITTNNRVQQKAIKRHGINVPTILGGERALKTTQNYGFIIRKRDNAKP